MIVLIFISSLEKGGRKREDPGNEVAKLLGLWVKRLQEACFL